MRKITAIHWFRNDLRLSDNPSLNQAIAQGRVLPIYILDDNNAGEFAMGGASRWWLHYALQSLDKDLGGNLSLYRGQPLTILQSLIERFNVTAVFWNRTYEPWQIKRDTHIKQVLKANNIAVESHNATLLWEPWTVKKKDGTPYKVFTPYYRKGCLYSSPPHQPLSMPGNVDWLKDDNALTLPALRLLPHIRWDEKFKAHWTISEDGAHDCLEIFIKAHLSDYKDGRNYPAQGHTSRLSPYLHFGQISPQQIWHTVKAIADNAQVDTFCSELAWREFSYYLLYHHPNLPRENLQPKFNRFTWLDDNAKLTAWQRGQTGIPLVDAGMRELWQTGSMHNRVRMVVGSFLVKNLRLHWHHGERWFWDCLVDADLASNSASWQWIAGCGADAVPYFRIFNPVTQGEKFDPNGDYIRRYIPEIAGLPNKYLFAPWTAPDNVLQNAGIDLGKTYAKPIVDLKLSRQQALEAFKQLSK
ncbi:MAG: deoxyribodipyrimidine photolyase [Gammaproteobacteria bacterium]|nr:MAG: deoxyribodipyrimidine photolyase [Gammaproteobacteria bacterium]